MRRLSRNCDEDWLLKAGGIASGNNYTFHNSFLWITAMIKKIKSRNGFKQLPRKSLICPF